MASRKDTSNEKWAYDIPIDTFKKGEIYNEDVLNQSIEMILLTLFGKRLFNTGFGSDFRNRLFDTMTEDYGTQLLNDTVGAIKRWENRIVILESEVKLVLDPDSNRAIIEIPYYIPIIGQKALFKKKIIG